MRRNCTLILKHARRGDKLHFENAPLEFLVASPGVHAVPIRIPFPLWLHRAQPIGNSVDDLWLSWVEDGPILLRVAMFDYRLHRPFEPRKLRLAGAQRSELARQEKKDTAEEQHRHLPRSQIRCGKYSQRRETGYCCRSVTRRNALLGAR